MCLSFKNIHLCFLNNKLGATNGLIKAVRADIKENTLQGLGPTK